MKTCPQCGSQYTDDTLQFCLQDGTPLVAPSSGDTPTVVLGETETFARPAGRSHVPGDSFQNSAFTESQVTQIAVPHKRGSGVWMIVGGIVVILIMTLIGLGIGGYILYSRDPGTGNILQPQNVNSNNAATPGNTTVKPSPSTSATAPRATPTVAATPVETPSIGIDQARNEVLQRVDAWRAALEARDFNGYMNNYDDTVDYYKRRGVSISSVRADKARAFQLFNSMQVQISNQSASVSPAGDTASVTFDKEWHFTGRSRSDGKTRSQLEFSRINGRWLITAERDLQLYYKR